MSTPESDGTDDTRSDDAHRDDPLPTNEQLVEPSTEKDPGEEPKASTPDDPEPSHEAVGIGIVDAPPLEHD